MSLQQGDAAAPPSLNGAELLRQINDPLKLWSIHAVGDAVTLCHDAACAPCTHYVQHLVSHMGTFDLSPEQVKEAVCKAWPHIVDTIRQEAERPLNERYASLQHYQLSELGRLQELKDEYTDLCARHKELEVLCKV
jgi:hypothetical protein